MKMSKELYIFCLVAQIGIALMFHKEEHSIYIYINEVVTVDVDSKTAAELVMMGQKYMHYIYHLFHMQK
jgi:hypothetical protein